MTVCYDCQRSTSGPCWRHSEITSTRHEPAAPSAEALARAIATVWPAPGLEGEVNNSHRSQARQILDALELLWCGGLR